MLDLLILSLRQLFTTTFYFHFLFYLSLTSQMLLQDSSYALHVHFAASIPPYATGPAIILVGSLMMVNIVKIRWNNVNESVPAFLTMIVMPLTYSIAYGELVLHSTAHIPKPHSTGY